MRRLLLLLPPIALGCSSGGFFGPEADSAVFVGAVTGTVIGVDGLKASSASVYLAENASSQPNEYGGTFANAEGHFQIEAVEGVYTLVAHEPGYVAYVSDVRVVGGDTRDIGEVQLEECSPVNPCPPQGTPTPAPPPSFVIEEFTADYTDVQRYTYPEVGYDEIYVRAENFTQGIELTLSILDPTLHSPGAWSLTTGGIWGALTYLPPDGGYNSYLPVSGSLLIDDWGIDAGGVVTVRVSNAVCHWYDPYSDTTSAAFTATITSSTPMSGYTTQR